MRYTDANGDGEIANYYDGTRMVKEILGQDSYYPFGLTHTNYNSMIAKYKRDEENDTKSKPDLDVLENLDYQYKYQGQERQDELGLNWDSFKWRNYDYALGRFMSVDPLVEQIGEAYIAMSNNPVNRVDPDGRAAVDRDDIIDVDIGTGQTTVTKAEGNDIVRLVNEGKVVDSYVYGEKGSFNDQNTIKNHEVLTTTGEYLRTDQVITSMAPYKLFKFFEFA